MRPHVIDYLKTHTFRQLKDEHGINARPNASMNKLSLNYDQIASKPSNPVSNQCRGMVIRPLQALPAEGWEDVIVGETKILAWPMYRFFNQGDPNGSQVDWNDREFRIYEKLDGTMCILYWDDLEEKWHVATRSVSEADLPIKKDHLVIGNKTFSQMFMESLERTWSYGIDDYSVFGVTTSDILDTLAKSLTYVFEFTSPYNKIVVKYKEPRISLIAVRDNTNGNELNVDTLDVLRRIPRPKKWCHLANDCNGLIDFVNSTDPAEIEGAVIIDSKFNRLKIKSKPYLLSFRIKDMLMLSRRSVLEGILGGHMDDVLPSLEPDLAKHIVDLQDRVAAYFKGVDQNFLKWKTEANGDRKAFATLVKQSEEWHVPYYNLLNGGFASASEWAMEAVTAHKLSQATLEYLVNKLKWFPSVG